MQNKPLAKGLIDFINNVPDFWEDLREVVELRLAVVAKKAEELGLPTKMICPENRGDHFRLGANGIVVSY